MDRRAFLKTAVTSTIVAGFAGGAGAVERYFPSKVDQALFEGINHTKDPTKKTPLEKGHAPVITAPASVKSGEQFTVEVAIGESMHPIGPTHWIEYIELYFGNEPAGRLEIQPKGYLKPKASFTLVITKELAPAGKITLVARERCNLHGLWEASIDLSVT